MNNNIHQACFLGVEKVCHVTFSLCFVFVNGDIYIKFMHVFEVLKVYENAREFNFAIFAIALDKHRTFL